MSEKSEGHDRKRPVASEPALDHEPSADLPSVDSLDVKSDFSMFLSSGVSEGLRKRALRKLFHLPLFHQRDGLDDYDDDYRSFHQLGDIITAHLRHQLERQVDKVKEENNNNVVKNQEEQTGVGGAEAIALAGSTNSRAVKRKEMFAEGESGLEKPQVIQYLQEDCGHGPSSLRGCTRCLDGCPGRAIVSGDHQVRVDTTLCQGCGVCVTVCPSGCMTTVEPLASHVLDSVRSALRDRHLAGEDAATVFLYDRRIDASKLTSILDRVRRPTLIFPLENIGVVGMDVWLTLVAYGADEVGLLVARETQREVLHELENQRAYAAAVLDGMGYSGDRLKLVEEGGEPQFSRAQSQEKIPPATFSPSYNKRIAVDLAVAHLNKYAPARRATVDLPESAPYGTIRIKGEACTLCMACVAVCPAASLVDGGAQPELHFSEANCVQCGLCRQACPENAIRLSPRFVYDREAARELQVLHTEEIFCCIECGEPYATQKMVEKIAEKLADHWMFKGAAEKRRLQMCSQCRVRDVFQR